MGVTSAPRPGALVEPAMAPSPASPQPFATPPLLSTAPTAGRRGVGCRPLIKRLSSDKQQAKEATAVMKASNLMVWKEGKSHGQHGLWGV